MFVVIIWYLVISILGWGSIPLSYRLFSALDDRGYAFSRIFSLLLWGYIFWILASLQVLPNNVGGLSLALIVVLVGNVWLLRAIGWEEIKLWLGKRKKYVLSIELLFLISFALLAVVRAANPEILGTEKPMELAFTNAILRSESFPPHDPWLSGYAISYYYFGYVVVAMLAKLIGVEGGVAFNLGIITVFALTAVGSYGMVYNLLALRNPFRGSLVFEKTDPGSTDGDQNLGVAFLGPLVILLVSNLEGFLEALHARGLFWRLDKTGILTSRFWQWLDIKNLNEPPTLPFSWMPSRYLWWWRASRVLQDYDFAGNWKEVIDEFPVFSYLLADLHPHVLAMPFAFLAMAFALNLFNGGVQGKSEARCWHVNIRTLVWSVLAIIVLSFLLVVSGVGSLRLSQVVLGLVGLTAGGFFIISIRPTLQNLGLSVFIDKNAGKYAIGLPVRVEISYLVFSAIVLGGLSFLNTWDFPIYVALFAGAYALRRWMVDQVGSSQILKDFIGFGFAAGITGVLLYFPFYLGFSSQAGGFIPNFVYITRGAHLWVMFAPLMVLFGLFMVYLWVRMGSKEILKKGILLALGLMGLMWVFSLLLLVVIYFVPGLVDLFLSSISAPDLKSLFQESILRRMTHSGGWLTLAILLSLALGLLYRLGANKWDDREETQYSSFNHLSHGFGLLLVLLGTLLVISPEFLFLRDLFGYRINTIFKFYYQAWLLWGVAAAYGAAVLWQDLRKGWHVLYGVILFLVLGMGLTYTVLGTWTKTNGFNPPQGWNLDGTAYYELQSPDEMAAIGWLRQAPLGVIAEAVGGSYSAYARVSTLSGQPTVLGWPGHENQWRGGYLEIGSREGDIARLYCTRDWFETQAIIDQYEIKYIFIGNLERVTYSADKCLGGLNESIFMRNLEIAFRQGDVTVYAVH